MIILYITVNGSVGGSFSGNLTGNQDGTLKGEVKGKGSGKSSVYYTAIIYYVPNVEKQKAYYEDLVNYRKEEEKKEELPLERERLE